MLFLNTIVDYLGSIGSRGTRVDTCKEGINNHRVLQTTAVSSWPSWIVLCTTDFTTALLRKIPIWAITASQQQSAFKVRVLQRIHDPVDESLND